MQLRIIYEDILRQKVAPVTVFDEALKREADEMLLVMKKYAGVGLAGNQVGLDKRMIVLGYQKTDKNDEMPNIPTMQLCNPEIIKLTKEKDVVSEGCLSLPGLELPVERSVGVVVKAQDITGKPIQVKAKGLLSRVLQHEIDHLNGVLFTDRALRQADEKDCAFAKIVFLGSDDFSAPIFDGLVGAGLNVIAAITETAKRSGRGNELADPLMKQVAVKNHVAVFQPETIAELENIITQLEPDLLVLASYGKILPEKILNTPIFGALNVHPSLLPKYRGATPIQSAILAGDDKTGVSIIEMSPKVDAGLLVAQQVVPIGATDTFIDLKQKLAARGAEVLIKTIPAYLSGLAMRQAQDETTVTKTYKLTKEIGEIDWSRSAAEIDRQIRALNPWPGSYTFLEGKRLKVLRARLSDDRLKLEEVQLEGKNSTLWSDFVRGYQQQLTKTAWYGKIDQ